MPSMTSPVRILAPRAPRPAPDAEPGRITGYASLFDVPDHSGDVVAPGAFAASLARRGAGGIRMLFQHDPREPVGIWTKIVETARGLHVEGHLTLECIRGRDLAALIASGAVDGLSIGFKTRASRPLSRTAGRRLLEIDLWEISIVTFPMLAGARLSGKRRSSCPRIVCRPHTDPVTPAHTDNRTGLRLAALADTLRNAARQRVDFTR